MAVSVPRQQNSADVDTFFIHHFHVLNSLFSGVIHFLIMPGKFNTPEERAEYERKRGVIRRPGVVIDLTMDSDDDETISYETPIRPLSPTPDLVSPKSVVDLTQDYEHECHQDQSGYESDDTADTEIMPEYHDPIDQLRDLLMQVANKVDILTMDVTQLALYLIKK